MHGVSGILERLYSRFLLRDVLGFVAPGAISLFSLWSICHVDSVLEAIAPESLVTFFRHAPAGWQILAFLAAAYLLAWALQAVVYGVVNLIMMLVRLVSNKIDKIHEIVETSWRLVPLVSKNEACVEQVEAIVKKSWWMTRISLQSDLVLAKSFNDKLLEQHLTEFPYSERLSALAIMSHNLAIASILLIWSILRMCPHLRPLPFVVLMLLVPASLYIEYWRLINARDRQTAIYATEFRNRTPPPPADDPTR